METQCWNERENREKTPGHVQEKNTSCSLRNLSIKRQRLSGWIKMDTTTCHLHKKSTLNTKTYRLKVKGWKKMYCVSINQKKPKVAIY